MFLQKFQDFPSKLFVLYLDVLSVPNLQNTKYKWLCFFLASEAFIDFDYIIFFTA